jgi:hypothetical protein
MALRESRVSLITKSKEVWFAMDCSVQLMGFYTCRMRRIGRNFEGLVGTWQENFVCW